MELESSSATRRRGRLKTHEGLHRTLTQITESEEDLARRREALSGKAAVSEQRPELKAIATSIDAARALGADVDARCASAQRKADLAASSLNQALTRLAPWAGDAEGLLVLPRLAQDEIDHARATLTDLAVEIAREEQSATRSLDEAATLVLQMRPLASGAAVSPDEIAAARSQRADRWLPLRKHVLSNAPRQKEVRQLTRQALPSSRAPN